MLNCDEFYKLLIHRVDSEYQVFCATMNWVNHDISNRRRWNERRSLSLKKYFSSPQTWWQCCFPSCFICQSWSLSLLSKCLFQVHIWRAKTCFKVYIWRAETCATASRGDKAAGELCQQLHRPLLKGSPTFLDAIASPSTYPCQSVHFSFKNLFNWSHHFFTFFSKPAGITTDSCENFTAAEMGFNLYPNIKQQWTEFKYICLKYMNRQKMEAEVCFS